MAYYGLSVEEYAAVRYTARKNLDARLKRLHQAQNKRKAKKD